MIAPRLARILIVAVLAAVIAGVGGSARAAGLVRAQSSRVVDARVLGSFAMVARVTVATNVPGERVGERLRRRWTIFPERCAQSTCRLLRLDRQRSAGRHARVTLHRVGVGRYEGRGSFYVGLRCLGRTYRYGSRVPYRITLTVRGTTKVQGIAFARWITASYSNPSRSDTTPCPLGPSRDAARYSGAASSPVPAPPLASFRVAVNAGRDTASFADTSHRGLGGAAIVAVRWGFGDTASGLADSSAQLAPTHRFSAPGVYSVTLTVTDENGLKATATEQVTAPGPPTAAFTFAEVGSGPTFSFQDASSPGVGGAPSVSWRWDFGDPGSGPLDTSTARDPSHTFSGPGSYSVTLSVTDANGLGGSTTQTVRYPP
ncbi:MAG: PKD domain-containing protein [Solirubrobacteraceae bacterium]